MGAAHRLAFNQYDGVGMRRRYSVRPIAISVKPMSKTIQTAGR
jgi:hypothetical protein